MEISNNVALVAYDSPLDHGITPARDTGVRAIVTIGAGGCGLGYLPMSGPTMVDGRVSLLDSRC
jgi:hypothetical protein